MKYFQPLTALVCLTIALLTISPLQAAEQPAGTDNNGNVLSQENLEELITTLESQTAREDFLSKLRTLAAADSGQADDEFSVGSFLNMDATSNAFISNYMELIDSLGFSETTGGALIVLIIATLIIMVLILANNKLARILDRRTDFLRNALNTPLQRFSLVFRIQRWFGYAVGAVLLLYTISELVPGLSGIFSSESGMFLIDLTLSAVLLGTLLVITWEFVNAFMEYGMSDVSRANSTRVKTLLPVVRNIAFFAICGFAALVMLSEIGIDVMPLLAGAGVLGIAIGFGAQTMVKDFLNGFIIILEDLLQVGDVVTIGGRRGEVEQITLRKVQLRNLDGTVHTVPHSEISIIDNMTKEYTYFLTDIGVAYKEDVDKVIDCLHRVDEELREEEDFKDRILEPLQVFGLDEFADSALLIKVRIKTRSHDRWKVGREFNRRVKIAFDKAGIEIPFPHRTVFMNQVTDDSQDRQRDAQADTS